MKQETVMASVRNSILVVGALSLIAGAFLFQEVAAVNMMEQMEQTSSGKQPATATLAVIESPEAVVRVLEGLLRSILLSVSVDTQSFAGEPQKRGLDLGISRGFSGSQAGKHLMGLSAASFANGPGR